VVRLLPQAHPPTDHNRAQRRCVFSIDAPCCCALPLSSQRVLLEESETAFKGLTFSLPLGHFVVFRSTSTAAHAHVLSRRTSTSVDETPTTVVDVDKHPVAVLSEANTGMTTLLKLVAGQIFPTEGTVEMPPHTNRVLVATEPMLFDDTLMNNLRIGIVGVSDDCFCASNSSALCINVLWSVWRPLAFLSRRADCLI
jgi:hypothetical protein